jgi:hypothetical protein
MTSKFILLMLCVVHILAQDPEEPPPGPPNLCEGLSNIFVNDPTSCAAYFFCANGQSIGGSCGEGFFFNEAEQLCDFEKNVPCIDCPPTGVAVKPVPQSCTGFIVYKLFLFLLFCCTIFFFLFSCALMVFLLVNKSVPKICILMQH